MDETISQRQNYSLPKNQKTKTIWVDLLLDQTEWKGKILFGVLIRVPEDVFEMERYAYHFHSLKAWGNLFRKLANNHNKL